MPARPAAERTTYVYDKKRDAVLLHIDGTPATKIHLSEEMLKLAAKELKEGRNASKEAVASSSA